MPLARAGVPMAPTKCKTLAAKFSRIRDQHSGLIYEFQPTNGVPGVNSAIMNVLKQQCYLAPFHVSKTEMVGPKVGAELRQKAVLATLYALGGMLVYIAFRFEWIYGVGAVIACFHDTIITIGLFSLFNKEISHDGDRGVVDAGRLLHERHDRHLRSHPRESEALAPRAAGHVMNAP